eukprot:gene20047-20578_t
MNNNTAASPKTYEIWLEINGVTYVFEYISGVDPAFAAETLAVHFCEQKGSLLLGLAFNTELAVYSDGKVLPHPGFVIKTKDTTSGTKVFVNVMHHEDGKIYEEKNKILAYIDKNYCQDKKDTPLLYYGVVLPLSLYLQVQKSEKKKLSWIIEKINLNFDLKLDIDEYSIPKISKCFIGDTIDRVELGSGAENLPADLDAEEVKFSDNGPSSNLEKEEVRSIAPLLETTDQLHTHDASGTSGPIIQEDHNHEIVPATSHESNDSSIPSKPILPEAASATSAPTEISPSIPDEEESPQVEQVSYSAIRPVEPLTAPMMLRGWMKKQ